MPAAHASHAGASLARENVPAGHGRQRALEYVATPAASASSVSYVPGGHGCFASQKGWPGSVWNLPPGQTSQEAALTAREKCIAPHGSQARSELALGGRSSRWPGMHWRAVWKGRFCELRQKCSAGHGSHVPLSLSP